MIAKDVHWDVSMAEIWEILEMKNDEFAAVDLDLPVETYANMNRDERYDYAAKYFSSHERVNTFMKLPNQVDLPNRIYKEDLDFWFINNYDRRALKFNLFPEKTDLKNFFDDLKELIAEYEKMGVPKKLVMQTLTESFGHDGAKEGVRGNLIK